MRRSMRGRHAVAPVRGAVASVGGVRRVAAATVLRTVGMQVTVGGERALPVALPRNGVGMGVFSGVAGVRGRVRTIVVGRRRQGLVLVVGIWVRTVRRRRVRVMLLLGGMVVVWVMMLMIRIWKGICDAATVRFTVAVRFVLATLVPVQIVRVMLWAMLRGSRVAAFPATRPFVGHSSVRRMRLAIDIGMMLLRIMTVALRIGRRGQEALIMAARRLPTLLPFAAIAARPIVVRCVFCQRGPRIVPPPPILFFPPRILVGRQSPRPPICGRCLLRSCAFVLVVIVTFAIVVPGLEISHSGCFSMGRGRSRHLLSPVMLFLMLLLLLGLLLLKLRRRMAMRRRLVGPSLS